MFSTEDKPKAATFLLTGQTLGTMLGYSLFTPLNDLDWLNQFIFTNNPLDNPILTHTKFCYLVAIMIFVQIAFNLLFIAEEKMTDKKARDICKIIMIIPRHFTNSNMRNFILYMFGCRFCFFMLDFTIDFKLARNGYLNLGRSMITNIDTIDYPVVFVFSGLTVFYMRQGYLMKSFHLTMCFVAVLGVFRMLTYEDLLTNRDYWRVVAARLVSGILQGIDFSQMFLLSFFSVIVNKAVGNTGITVLIALMNQTASISRTIGLYLTAILPYETFEISCLAGQVLLLILLWPLAKSIDSKDPRVFDVSEPEQQAQTQEADLLPGNKKEAK